MKYEIVLKVMVILAIFISVQVIFVGCSTEVSTLEEESSDDALKQQEDQNSQKVINIDKLEVFHFHASRQCYSCITVGNYAEETLNTYFADELEQGIIVFRKINGELAENRDIVEKYGATGSSIWLGTYDSGRFEAEQNIEVWYKLRDKQDYMDHLKGVIEQKLAGS